MNMRLYERAELERAWDIIRPFVTSHSEPVAWELESVHALGINDINNPEWVDAPLMLNGTPLDQNDDNVVPVFWGCGMTLQEAVTTADQKETIMSHAPVRMIVLDMKDEDVLSIFSDTARK